MRKRNNDRDKKREGEITIEIKRGRNKEKDKKRQGDLERNKEHERQK